MNKNIKVAKELIKLAKSLVAGNGAGINFTLNKDTEGSIKFVAKLQNNKFKCSNLRMDDFKFGTFNAIDNEGYGQSKVPFEYVFKLNEIPVEIKDIEELLNYNSEQIIEELTSDLIFRKYDSDNENYDDARKEIQTQLNNIGLSLGLKCIPYKESNGQFSWGWTRDYVKNGDLMPNFGCSFCICDLEYEKRYGNGNLNLYHEQHGFDGIPADNMNITFTDSGAKWYNSLFVDMDYYDDDDDDYEEDDQLSDSFKNNMF